MTGAAGYERRRGLAEDLRRDLTAELVTAEFLERHPEWVDKFGERARIHGIEDARFHVDFLAAAIEAGSLEAFREYGAWCARMLGARRIESKFLLENLEQLRDALVGGLDEEGRTWVEQMVAAACAAAAETAGTAGRPEGPLSPAAGDALAADRRLYLEAALRGHRATALSIALECVERDLSVPEIYHELLQPVQYEIGWRWEANEISVAHSLVATATSDTPPDPLSRPPSIRVPAPRCNAPRPPPA